MNADSPAPQEPVSHPVTEPNWVLETWARGLLEVVRRPFLSYRLIDCREEAELENQRAAGRSAAPKRKWDKGRAFYLLGWLVVLFLAWLINPGVGWVMIVVGLLASWRLLEILVTGLGTALGQTAQVRARNLVTIGVYGLQMTLIFAIVYHSFATTGFGGGTLASSDYLYISWAAVTSLGNDTFRATSEGARFLEVATTTAGIFLLAVLLAFGINEVKKTNRTESDVKTASPGNGQPAAAMAQATDGRS
jgi:hypothetical protein